ncbi:MAG: TIGR02677 family protein, partial [Candidatus Rokuibacteriota bacterium]
MTDATGRLRVFAYINADKAALYRAVMRAFVDAKGRFTLHLRPQEVTAALASASLPEPADAAAVETALAQLREWGNLEAHPDTADVATVEEFYRPRYLFQLTREGEAAERALAVYEEALGQRGELQSAALADIRMFLGELAELAEAPEPDEGKAYHVLRTLRDRFDELTSRAQAFMSSLQRTIDLQGVDVPKFLAYKETLIGYLERFIGELVVATAEITTTIRRIEGLGIERLLQAAARRDLADALDPTAEDHAAAHAGWRARWAGLRSWFIGHAGTPSQAEILRARARAAIPALLAAVASINDRRFTRSDRSADLRTLARWFAEADSDEAAHRLWRVAFALAPARHLLVDAETLEQREARP